MDSAGIGHLDGASKGVGGERQEVVCLEKGRWSLHGRATASGTGVAARAEGDGSGEHLAELLAELLATMLDRESYTADLCHRRGRQCLHPAMRIMILTRLG